jgi:ectoine hydroxylase-related dioxygenase (phytanoyl-CoA dioxygenase family)
MYRFQTPPADAGQLLLSCSAIYAIVSQVSSIIAGLSAKKYVPHQISVIFSRPFGQEQGLHQDDHRDPSSVDEEGEMISALVAFMKDTKLDIGTDSKDLYHSSRRHVSDEWSVPSWWIFI